MPYFFQIFYKFQEKTKYLIIVFQKPCKKKLMFFTIPIIEKKEKLYIEIYYSNKNIVQTNNVLI